MDENNIQALFFTNDTASEYWRALGIAERFNRLSNSRMFVTNYHNWNDDIVGANLVILEQLSNPLIPDYVHSKGGKVVFESDDAMIDSYGRERKNLMDMTPAFRGHAIETIGKCDAITVTNRLLAENYARFTDKPIYVLPNYIDDVWYTFPDKRIERVTDEIRIGWAGSRSHFEDLRMLVPILGQILEKYKNVRFIYCGYGGMSSDKRMTEMGWGEDVFKELPKNRREFVLATKPEYWPQKHYTLDLDIGLCPLVDDYFNKCKTIIKWMEYAALGNPSVVSDVLYGDVVKNGKDGFVAKTPEDWLEYLSFLIEHPKERRKMGKAARHSVEKDWSLDRYWYRWELAYKEIVYGLPLDKNLATVLRYQ